MEEPIVVRGERTFRLEDRKVVQEPSEIELARITYRRRWFEVELVVRVKMHYWGLYYPEIELGDDMLQYTLTARIYGEYPLSRNVDAAMTIQREWRLPWSLKPGEKRSEWLIKWCEQAIFNALLREVASEQRYLINPVLEEVAKAANFIETTLKEAKEERQRIAPAGRTLLLTA